MHVDEKKQLTDEVKNLIIEKLKITHITAEDVDNDTPLFGKDNPFGLDSIDAIEIVLALKEKYDVRLADQNLAREILLSVNTIAEFLEKELKQK